MGVRDGTHNHGLSRRTRFQPSGRSTATDGAPTASCTFSSTNFPKLSLGGQPINYLPPPLSYLRGQSSSLQCSSDGCPDKPDKAVATAMRLKSRIFLTFRSETGHEPYQGTQKYFCLILGKLVCQITNIVSRSG